MKKMQVVSLLTAICILGSSNVTVFAMTDSNPGVAVTNEIENVNTMSNSEYQEILNQVHIQAIADITPSLIASVRQIDKKIKNSRILEKQTRATYDSARLESVLAMSDGCSSSQILSIGMDAFLARDEAARLYSDTEKEMKKDAFRHMTWNFRSYKSTTESATRIVTINHEWVPIILSTVESYNSGRLDYYYKKYQNELIWGTIMHTQ